MVYHIHTAHHFLLPLVILHYGVPQLLGQILPDQADTRVLLPQSGGDGRFHLLIVLLHVHYLLQATSTSKF